MQYKVPQNVDIEDKVIGPLTVRQFIILLVAVGVILVLNFILIGPLRMIFFLAATIIGALSSIVAFVKYGDQNFEVFLLSAFKTFATPRKRVWKKEPFRPREEVIEKPKHEESIPPPKKSIDEAKNDLSRLAEIVDSGGYSIIEDPERQTNIINATSTKDDVGVTDFLIKAEGPNEKIDPIIDSAAQIIPKREELVSEIASIDPSEKPETPKIKLRKEEFK